MAVEAEETEVVAAAAGPSATDRQASEHAPALVDARAFAFLIVPVRLALAFAGLLASRLSGASPDAALSLFVFAAFFTAFCLLASRRHRSFWSRAEAAIPFEGEPRRESWLRTVTQAMYPSTIGLTILTAIALVVDASLAAFLSGVIAGLAVGSLVFGVEILAWERRKGARMLLQDYRVYLA